jgi:hypothetical protein
VERLAQGRDHSSLDDFKIVFWGSARFDEEQSFIQQIYLNTGKSGGYPW